MRFQRIAMASLSICAASNFGAPASAQSTVRASIDSSGAQADAGAIYLALSADGRFVAFDSSSTNLVSGDTNGVNDVFVRDLQSSTTERVSVSSAGDQADNGSDYVAISADGRFVAFSSAATNLVAGDTNGSSDIFVRDLQSGTTERVSVDSSGGEAEHPSDGAVAISADGRYVAFASLAMNLVADDTNGRRDVFVHDRQSGATERVNVSSAGDQADGDSVSWGGIAISADGRYVVFESDATNLVANDTNGFFRTSSYATARTARPCA